MKYFARVRYQTTGHEAVKVFDSMLARGLFIISTSGYVAVLDQWSEADPEPEKAEP